MTIEVGRLGFSSGAGEAIALMMLKRLVAFSQYPPPVSLVVLLSLRVSFCRPLSFRTILFLLLTLALLFGSSLPTLVLGSSLPTLVLGSSDWLLSEEFRDVLLVCFVELLLGIVESSVSVGAADADGIIPMNESLSLCIPQDL